MRVFVVWFNMYPGDRESRWPREIFTDSRVIQAWDEPKAAGRWFMSHLSEMRPSRGGAGVFPQPDGALWDTYLLFDRDATWNATPTAILSWGSSVLQTRQKLADDVRYASNRDR